MSFGKNDLGLNFDAHDSFGSLSDGYNHNPSSESPGTGSYGTMMAAGMFSSMFATIGNMITQSAAIEAQGKYRAHQMEFNAKMADLQAQDALNQGEQDAQRINREGNAAVAETRVGAAAAGIEVNSGSAMDVQSTSKRVSAIDALTARNNATRQAYGFQVQANNDRSEAKMTKQTSEYNSNATLLSGGMSAIGEGVKGFYYGGGGTIKSDERNFNK